MLTAQSSKKYATKNTRVPHKLLGFSSVQFTIHNSSALRCILRKTPLPIGNAFILTSTQTVAKYNDSHQQTFSRNSNTFRSFRLGYQTKPESNPAKPQRMKVARETSKG